MLKKIGLIVVGIIFAALIFPMVLPETSHVERRVNIHNSPAAIYAVLIDFQQFRSWDPWSAMEPESTFKVEGQGLNSVYSWEGKKVGKGSMTIKDVKENERVDILLQFFEPFPGDAKTAWILTDLGNGETEVVWKYEQKMGYFPRYFGMMMDGMLGGQFELGLTKLKALLEAKTS